MHFVRRTHHHGGPDHVRSSRGTYAAAEAPTAAHFSGCDARSRSDASRSGPGRVSGPGSGYFLWAGAGLTEVGTSAHPGIPGARPGGTGLRLQGRSAPTPIKQTPTIISSRPMVLARVMGSLKKSRDQINVQTFANETIG